MYNIDTKYQGIHHEHEIFCPEQNRKIKKKNYIALWSRSQ
jgi:hypothetical protein